MRKNVEKLRAVVFGNWSDLHKVHIRVSWQCERGYNTLMQLRKCKAEEKRIRDIIDSTD